MRMPRLGEFAHDPLYDVSLGVLLNWHAGYDHDHLCHTGFRVRDGGDVSYSSHTRLGGRKRVLIPLHNLEAAARRVQPGSTDGS